MDRLSNSRKYLPALSNGAFDDPRLTLLIQDGIEFVAHTDQKFDVIICDSTDPVGPGKVLFTEEFYGYCKNALTEKGIFVNQNGVPFMQKNEFTETLQRRSVHFKHAGFYLTVVPTYVGGFMAIGWATNCDDYQNLSEEVLKSRLEKVSGTMRYYNPAIHKASFALPQFMLEWTTNLQRSISEE